MGTALLTDTQKIAACYITAKAGAAFVKTCIRFAGGGATPRDVHTHEKDGAVPRRHGEGQGLRCGKRLCLSCSLSLSPSPSLSQSLSYCLVLPYFYSHSLELGATLLCADDRSGAIYRKCREMLQAGADRIGTSSGVQIMEGA